MTNLIARAPMSTKLYRDALGPDTRTLAEKANDDALMRVRGQINNLLTPTDSHDFISALDASENKWSVINSPKYHPLAILVNKAEKASHTSASRFKLQKAAAAAQKAGWSVTWDPYNIRVILVKWVG